MADMPGLHTVSIRRVHVLSEGEWTGVQGGAQKYTRADLLAFAKNHARIVTLGAYVPQYIHHNDDPLLPDQPTVGMVDALYVEDDADGKAGLYMDLTDVPIQIAQLMKLKSIRGRSIEGIRVKTRKGFTVKGERFDQVITGVALLGTALPAVDGLEDIPDFISLFEMDDAKVAAGKGQRGVVFDFDVPFAHAAYETDEGDLELPPEDLGDALEGTPTAPELTDGEKKEMILVAWKAKNKPTGDEWPYVDDIDSTTAYISIRGDLLAVPYTVTGNAATIGTPTRVRRGITYIPIGASKGLGGGPAQDALTALNVLGPRVLAMAREAAATPGGSRAALDRVMLALDALGGELVGLVAGQRGAPIVRSRIRALKEEVLRIVGSTRNSKGSGMDLSDILGAFGLEADAEPKAITAALSKAPTTEQVSALLALADVGTGGDFANAEQFVSWLAGKLGVMPGNLGAIASAVAEALGMENEEPAPDAAPDAAPAPAPTAMSKGGTVVEAPEIVALRREIEQNKATVAELAKWKLETIAAADKNAAESRVDAAIMLGKFKASRRDELVALAKASPEAFDAVVGEIPDGASVPIGRVSHGRAPAAPDALEPSEEQITAVMRSGVHDRDKAVAMAREANYDEAGVPLPATKKE